MSTVYRSVASSSRPLRPLEPEDEMRLLLAGSPWPRGRELAVLVVMSILAVWNLVDGIRGYGKGLIGAPYFAVPLITTLVQWRRHRRYLRELRERGYDVSCFAAPVTRA